MDGLSLKYRLPLILAPLALGMGKTCLKEERRKAKARSSRIHKLYNQPL